MLWISWLRAEQEGLRETKWKICNPGGASKESDENSGRAVVRDEGMLGRYGETVGASGRCTKECFQYLAS
jgi:hypothetical protein